MANHDDPRPLGVALAKRNDNRLVIVSGLATYISKSRPEEEKSFELIDLFCKQIAKTLISRGLRDGNVKVPINLDKFFKARML